MAPRRRRLAIVLIASSRCAESPGSRERLDGGVGLGALQHDGTLEQMERAVAGGAAEG